MLANSSNSVDDTKQLRISEYLSELIGETVDLWKSHIEEQMQKTGHHLMFCDFPFPDFFLSGAGDIPSFRKLQKTVRPLVSFSSFWVPEGVDLVVAGLIDYVVYAAPLPLSRESTPSKNDISMACKLLLEDLQLETPPNRGFAIVSNLSLEAPVIELTDFLRLRRLSRFEIRAMKTDGGYCAVNFPEGVLEPDVHSRRIWPVHVVEYSSPRYFEDEDYDRISLLIQDVVSCLRLYWNCEASIGEIWIGSWCKGSRPITTREPHPELRKAGGQRWIGSGGIPRLHPIRRFPDIDEIQAKRLSEFWTVFTKLRGLGLKVTVRKRFYKALSQYNKYLGEEHVIDCARNLAYAVDTLTPDRGVSAYHLLAALATELDYNRVRNTTIEFYNKARIPAVHGGTISEEDILTVDKMGEIVRVALKNAVFLFGDSQIATGQLDYIEMLRKAKDDPSEHRNLHSLIPSWAKEKL